MKSGRQTLWTPLVRMGLVAGVVACLCFSAGEGLRLTPLPVYAETPASDGRPNVAETSEGRLSNCGPLDQPAQAQKRGKRQTPDWHSPPSRSVTEPKPRRLQSDCFHAPPRVASAQLVMRPPGRAPPAV